MSEERIFCVGLYLTKGGESAIVDAVLSLWIDGYILAGRPGAKRWIKCRWYPDGRYREEDLSSGLDPCDGDHLDLGVHLKTEITALTARLAAAEEAMKAAASLPGRLWLTGQLALAEFLSGEGGEHLDYALEQYEAAKGGRDE